MPLVDSPQKGAEGRIQAEMMADSRRVFEMKIEVIDVEGRSWKGIFMVDNFYPAVIHYLVPAPPEAHRQILPLRSQRLKEHFVKIEQIPADEHQILGYGVQFLDAFVLSLVGHIEITGRCIRQRPSRVYFAIEHHDLTTYQAYFGITSRGLKQ